MSERRRFLLLWAVVLGASGTAVVAFGRYGFSVVALGFLYAALATSWSWMRAAGLFSFGQAAFFGAGALTQAWLVTAGRLSPWLALGVSALAGALSALSLIPALRLSPSNFALATLAYAILLKSLSGNVPAFGTEGFLLPATPGFDGAAPSVVVTLAALALALGLGYEVFLGRPSGRAATAIRQAPETTLSLGIDLIGQRWRPVILSAAATALAGGLYAHLLGSVETTVVFSPTFSVLPLALGMLGGALHPLGGILGTLALYPVDELILRPALPQSHTLAYGVVLCGLLLFKPEGLLRARIRGVPTGTALRPMPRDSFSLAVRRLTVRRNGTAVLRDVSFVIEPGQTLRVLGPNGAGKTSLLLAIAGRLPASEGSILFGGVKSPVESRLGPGAAWPGRSRLRDPSRSGRFVKTWHLRQNGPATRAEWTGSWRSSS